MDPGGAPFRGDLGFEHVRLISSAGFVEEADPGDPGGCPLDVEESDDRELDPIWAFGRAACRRPTVVWCRGRARNEDFSDGRIEPADQMDMQEPSRSCEPGCE
jgi:hypothetical protein